MIIKLDSKLRRHKIMLFVLCSFNIKKMTWLFIGLLFAEQAISMSVEKLATGGYFQHWFDSLFLFFISAAYIYYTNAMGEFLLDLHLNAPKAQQKAEVNDE